MADLNDNLELVEGRIARAVQRAGRSRADVTLIAVTKVFPAETICEAHAAGLRDFGENYVQEFAGKRPAVGSLKGARFHMIGHLQSNKAKLASELFEVVHTVDTPRLARRLDEAEKRLDVFLEVKLSEEESKSGAAPDELPQLIDAVRACPHLTLRGLMTMPPWTDDAEPSRPYFRTLRELAKRHGVEALSMGMSHDFEVAIEEGATHIRVGTALFGPRRRK